MALASSASVAGARGGGVDRAGEAVVGEAVQDGADLVVEGDPAAVLAPGPILPPSPPGRGELSAPGAAVAAEDDAGAEEHGPDPAVGRRSGRRLPCPAHLGQEPRPRGRRLGQHLVPRSP